MYQEIEILCDYIGALLNMRILIKIVMLFFTLQQSSYPLVLTAY